MNTEYAKSVLKTALQRDPDLLKAFKEEDWKAVDTIIDGVRDKFDIYTDGEIGPFYPAINALDPELLKEILVELQYVPKYMFYGHRIYDFDVPEKVTQIKEGAFAYCQYLKDIKLPSTLEVIRGDAFLGSSISKIELPDSVEYLGPNCFCESSLKELHLSSSLSCFYGYDCCEDTNLQKLYVPENSNIQELDELEMFPDLVIISKDPRIANICAEKGYKYQEG